MRDPKAYETHYRCKLFTYVVYDNKMPMCLMVSSLNLRILLLANWVLWETSCFAIALPRKVARSLFGLAHSLRVWLAERQRVSAWKGLEGLLVSSTAHSLSRRRNERNAQPERRVRARSLKTNCFQEPSHQWEPTKTTHRWLSTRDRGRKSVI